MRIAVHLPRMLVEECRSWKDAKVQCVKSLQRRSNPPVEGIHASETRVVEGLSEERKRITSSEATKSNLPDNEWKRLNHPTRCRSVNSRNGDTANAPDVDTYLPTSILVVMEIMCKGYCDST